MTLRVRSLNGISLLQHTCFYTYGSYKLCQTKYDGFFTSVYFTSRCQNHRIYSSGVFTTTSRYIKILYNDSSFIKVLFYIPYFVKRFNFSPNKWTSFFDRPTLN